uniref:NADH dehydrogenase subunit 1 n=1 Tax=Chrysotila carterae TaxID=13221 RepID=UPI0023AB33E0|nr:NADH dehydrogenase subunit 1 [Chrysotila carterae]WCH62795.1 NADH dehydrogenase subunit 1 [Chrysotila carterae]
MFYLEKLLCFFSITLPLLIAVAYFTLVERKVMASIQQRHGPNFVGLFGLLQPIADAVKLIFKESVMPTKASTVGFFFAPVIALYLSLTSWSLIPFSAKAFFVNIPFSLLFLLAISSLNVYGVLISGWSSNSRYAFFGALRSAAQLISYEVSFGLILLSLLVCANSLNLLEIVVYQKAIYFFFPFISLFIMLSVSILAETNRAPFDLPEAESELVSGFNVEYSSLGFALFFLAEYCSMILMSFFLVILFFGGWLLLNDVLAIFNASIFSLKSSFVVFFYVLVRASFPRYRIDQLMRLCWKVFLPLSLSFFLLTVGVIYSFGNFC